MRLGFFVFGLLVCTGAAAAPSSGKNWRILIESLECHSADSLVAIGMRIDYLGPKGPVEAPLSRLLDGQNKRHPPRSLVWGRGSKPLAEWLARGGLANLQSESVAEVQLKFDVREAGGNLALEFGDIPALSLTRKRTHGCEGLLKPGDIAAAHARRTRPDKANLDFAVHRARYPCTPGRTISAEYPPHLPRQLLLFGRGYLPNARQVDLPMGKAPAQPYLYSGLDQLDAVEQAARQAIAADFPQYAAAWKFFAFNWGVQKAASGNELYSIGIYELRPCPK